MVIEACVTFFIITNSEFQFPKLHKKKKGKEKRKSNHHNGASEPFNLTSVGWTLWFDAHLE